MMAITERKEGGKRIGEKIYENKGRAEEARENIEKISLRK